MGVSGWEYWLDFHGCCQLFSLEILILLPPLPLLIIAPNTTVFVNNILGRVKSFLCSISGTVRLTLSQWYYVCSFCPVSCLRHFFLDYQIVILSRMSASYRLPGLWHPSSDNSSEGRVPCLWWCGKSSMGGRLVVSTTFSRQILLYQMLNKNSISRLLRVGREKAKKLNIDDRLMNTGCPQSTEYFC